MFLVKTRIYLKVNLHGLISITCCLLCYNTILGILHLSFHLISTNLFGISHYMSTFTSLETENIILHKKKSQMVW